MTTPSLPVDRWGRPCRVECRHVGPGWYAADVYAGDVLVRTEGPVVSGRIARERAERWLAVYLETGSWAKATGEGEK